MSGLITPALLGASVFRHSSSKLTTGGGHHLPEQALQEVQWAGRAHANAERMPQACLCHGLAAVLDEPLSASSVGSSKGPDAAAEKARCASIGVETANRFLQCLRWALAAMFKVWALGSAYVIISGVRDP